jgi:hypothetical protein
MEWHMPYRRDLEAWGLISSCVQSPGRALELRESLSTEPAASDSLIDGLLELLVPGHFHVALSDSEKTHMRSAVTHIRNKGCKLPGSGPVKTSDQVGDLRNSVNLDLQAQPPSMTTLALQHIWSIQDGLPF